MLDLEAPSEELQNETLYASMKIIFDFFVPEKCWCILNYVLVKQKR